MCTHNLNFAYIINNLNDDLNDIININDYLSNNKLKNDIKNKQKMLVCKYKHELIKYESKIIKCHFKHKSLMTNWHKEWQSHFEQREINIGDNRVDVLVNNNIIEYQHSYISKEDVESRYNNAITNNKILNWVIDCNNAIEVKQIGNIYMIYFYNEEWKFEHFICHDFIYLNIEDKIYKINPIEVKSNMVDVIEYKTKVEFIEAMKNDVNIWSIDILPQCTLYHNQRGAGCGKTYESIQLMDKDDKFKHKKLFIYLTKAHTAKEVIFNELQEQYERGSLSNLDISEKDIDDSSKQYKISYHNKNTNLDCEIIIGTIDSFMWAIGDKNKKDSNNYFFGIVDSIRKGYVNTNKKGCIKYSGGEIKLNKECLIIIDEAQDLGPEYIEAICCIMRNTYIDAYTIGDKLQSIWGEHNIHTFLENNDLPHIKINKSEGINKVMRFHNNQFKDFVNNIIDFNKYNLHPISQICDSNCKYKHENDIKPYTIFQIEQIYADESEHKKIEKFVQQVINYMNYEIDKYNYLPNNFMFIFPILSNNHVASRLEAKIQEFWIEKFNDENYQNNVLKDNSYWKNKINNNKYYKYIVLHKSDEGKSINLRESENATRILSIHASKGNGCEVVFLFGVTQYSLQMFSKDKCNLQYDSLLHVALTRQKKSLYVGIIDNGDDISKKFKNYIVINSDFKPNIDIIKKSNKYNKIIDYCFNNSILFKQVFLKYNDISENILPIESNKNNIIDWGHHIIRYCVFYYQFVSNIINNEKIHTDNSQFKTVLTKITNLSIQFKEHNEYYKSIKNIKKYNYFPILIFKSNDRTKYSKYKDNLKKFIKNIQDKIKKGINDNKLPILCPLESVILLHMIKLHDDGKYSDITIMDVYSLIYYFDECSDISSKCDCDCLCKETFINNINENNDKYKDIKESIINHYKKIEQINNLYKNYKKYVADDLENDNFEYNIYHNVTLFKDDNNFKISKKFELISYSNKYIIDFIIIPQFNKLNFNEIIIKGIFNNFLLNNSCKDHENNLIRYKNKKIYTCILSLDSSEPKFIDFNIDNKCPIIINSIKEYINFTYSENHKLLYYYYYYCYNNRPPKTNSIEYTYGKINDDNNSRISDGAKIPKYIENFFYDYNKELIKYKNKKDRDNITIISQKFNNIDSFMSLINEYLYEAINKYINDSEIYNDNDDDINNF